MSWTALYMAGFQVTLHGRFWVITEGETSKLEAMWDKTKRPIPI
jgi:hypothetical protein